MKLLFALALLAVSTTLPTTSAENNKPMYWNSGTNGTVAMGASLFNKVFHNLIPIIESVGTTIEIDAVTADHFSSSSFHLQELVIDSIDVTMSSPATLSVAISGVTIIVPATEFKVFTGSGDLKVTCTGDVTASIAGAHATIEIDLGHNATSNTLTGTALVPAVSVGVISISHTMRSKLCKVSGSAITVGLDAFKSTITKKANAALRGTLNSTLNNLMADSLPNFPVKFSTAPSVVTNTMQMTAEIIPPFPTPYKVATAAGAAPIPHIYADRDISIGINTQSFNNILASGVKDGFFQQHHVFDADHANTTLFKSTIPGAYAKCPECPLGMYFKAMEADPPSVTLGGQSLAFHFNKALLNVTAVASNGTAFKLFDLWVDITLALDNFTARNSPTAADTTVIHFNLSMPPNSFTMTQIKTYVGTTAWFGFLAPIAISSFILPEINKNFTGIPLKAVDHGYGLANWTIDLKQEAISLGADVVLATGKWTLAPPLPPTSRPDGKSHAKIIGIAVGGAVLLIVLLCLGCHFVRNRKEVQQGSGTYDGEEPTASSSLNQQQNDKNYSYGEV